MYELIRDASGSLQWMELANNTSTNVDDHAIVFSELSSHNLLYVYSSNIILYIVSLALASVEFGDKTIAVPVPVAQRSQPSKTDTKVTEFLIVVSPEFVWIRKKPENDM
jgi:hypothetical protein